MDIDVDKIFNKKEEERQSYPQPIVPQNEKPVENLPEISVFKKILIHLFFIVVLGAAGSFAFYSLSMGMFYFSAVFNENVAIFIIALSVMAFFAILYLYNKWRKKYDPNSILFRKW